MAKPKGLGRGLDALLGPRTVTGSDPDTSESLQTINAARLQPGKYQPRTQMDSESLAELASSIKARGVMQPILVRAIAGGNFEIIAGERRWRAAQLAGLRDVPAIVRVADDKAALAMALIENIQRENLNPIEEATGLERLIAEFGLTHETAAQAVGRSRSAVSNLLRLRALPQSIQTLIREGKLDMGHARALLPLDAARQIDCAMRIATEGLSARAAERLVAKLLEQRESATIPKTDRDVARLEENLSQRLGTRVIIQSGRKGRGKLIIEYMDLGQLDAILARVLPAQ